MLRNVCIFKIRLKRYQNCEELQEELQLHLLSFFYFIFQFLKLYAFLKLYYVLTCYICLYSWQIFWICICIYFIRNWYKKLNIITNLTTHCKKGLFCALFYHLIMVQ
jgi:hypothetical protein